MIKTEPHLPVAPPSGQQSTKPASPPKAPTVKPPSPMGKVESVPQHVAADEAMKARNEVIRLGHEEHGKTSIKPLVGKPLEDLHRKAWKAHDDKYKEHSGNYLHTPTEKSEKTSDKVHVKEFIVPISKGGMLRWHSACVKGDDSAKGQVIKGRQPDAEYSREAASALPGKCVGCSGDLGKDPNGVPVPPEDLSTEKSETDIANLTIAQDKPKTKFLDALKHHYAHLLQAHKLGKSESAVKAANMCAVYLRLMDMSAVPNELKNNSGVNLFKAEYPLDKEAKKLAKTLTTEAGGGVPSSDTQGSAMVKDEDKTPNSKIVQAKQLHKEGLKGWGNDYTITDRSKAVQAIDLYRKGGHNHLANHLQSILDNKNTKDLSMKKTEDNPMKKNEECDPGTYEPLNKMRGYMNRLAKCGEMAVVKAEHNPKGIQNPNTSGQGHHPDHADNPYHDTIVSHGYKYSHSTPVYGPSVTTKLGSPPERNVYLHHTYKHGTLKDHNVTVAMKGNKAHHWSVSVGGSGRETRDDDTNKLLDSFLKGHVSRAKKKTV